MKTLLFTLEYPPFLGGVANYYGNLVEHWPEQGGIIVLNDNENALIGKGWLKWLPSFFALNKKVKEEKIGHILVGHILPLGTVAYFYSKLTKTPYSVFLHGMDLNYALKTGRKKRIAKKILNSAEHVICANSYVAKTAESIIDKSKIVIVNPGVESRITQNEQRITQIKKEYGLHNKFILLSIGRLVKRKGFDKTIESLPEVLKIFPNSVYVVIGKGDDEDYLKNKIKELPKDTVIFLGSVSEEEKWVWLNACDVFVMPARDIGGDAEGFGIVYLEANLCGKPVIAGDSGGVRDAVQHELNGLLVNPENVKEISDAIMRLLINKNFRMKLGKHGRERVLKEFGWNEKVGEIYDVLMQNANIKV